MDNFFAQVKYQDFDYDPSQPVMNEFYRMCDKLGWSVGKGPCPQMKKARTELKEALVLQFNRSYGEDPESMDSWRSLCQIIRIAPIPDTMVECREVRTGYLEFQSFTHHDSNSILLLNRLLKGHM